MGCVAAKINLTIYEGGTFDKTFQWKTGTTPTAVDLTGYDARMAIREKLTDTSAILSLIRITDPWVADGDSGIYFDDGDEGYYRVYINDEDSAGICAEFKDIDGVYDLFLESPGGESVLKQYGTAKLKAAVTR